jgi:hypothetical protein
MSQQARRTSLPPPHPLHLPLKNKIKNKVGKQECVFCLFLFTSIIFYTSRRPRALQQTGIEVIISFSYIFFKKNYTSRRTQVLRETGIEVRKSQCVVQL